MKFIYSLRTFCINLLLVSSPIYTCLVKSDSEEHDIILLKPEDLDFIKFSNFSRGLAMNYSSSGIKSGLTQGFYLFDELNIYLQSARYVTNDENFLEERLNEIVRIAKDYIKVNLNGLSCNKNYCKAFLGCALEYGVNHYHIQNYAVPRDLTCFREVIALMSPKHKNSIYKEFPNPDFIHMIVLIT